jgi:hypothetical protein
MDTTSGITCLYALAQLQQLSACMTLVATKLQQQLVLILCVNRVVCMYVALLCTVFL